MIVRLTFHGYSFVTHFTQVSFKGFQKLLEGGGGVADCLNKWMTACMPVRYWQYLLEVEKKYGLPV
jgi:hypothetical protein